MLRWQHEPLTSSLTLLTDDRTRRLAVKAFRDILAFMGDRPLAKPLALAADLLATGLALPEMRDEILLQLAKQLSGNPSLASSERGWVLMHAALCTFPPSEELENFLELWLRERGAVPCVWAMHLTLYRGGPPRVCGSPVASELQAALERARAPPLPTLVVDLGAAHGGNVSPGGGAQDNLNGDAEPQGDGGVYSGSTARSARASNASRVPAPGAATQSSASLAYRKASSVAPAVQQQNAQSRSNSNTGVSFHDDIEAQMEAIARKFFPQA